MRSPTNQLQIILVEWCCQASNYKLNGTIFDKGGFILIVSYNMLVLDVLSARIYLIAFTYDNNEGDQQ